jgi:hypothetical protein
MSWTDMKFMERALTRVNTNRGAHASIALPAGSAITAGIIGEAVFEVVGLLIMPALLGMPLKPALLVASLFGSVAETDLPMPIAWAIHLFAGVVVFPLGYLIFRRITNLRPWALAGALWGVLLWLLAQAILAPLAGRPFMLGLIPYTWAALIAHILYTPTVAFVLERVSARLASRQAES